jgi:ataxia telangiectasia mutated family protein
MYRERDSKTIDAQLRRSFYREVDQLRRLGIESVAEIKAVLQSMMCLDQILRWRDAPTAGQDGNGVELPQWPDFEKISPEFECVEFISPPQRRAHLLSRFADLENVMSTRIALVRSVRQKEAQRRQIGDIVSPSIEACVKLEQQCLLSMSRAARDTNQTQIALNSIVKAQRLGVSSEVSQEYAKVLWSLNEPKLAVDHLADMVTKVAPTDSKLLKPTLLARLVCQRALYPAGTLLIFPTGYVDVRGLSPKANRNLEHLLRACEKMPNWYRR